MKKDIFFPEKQQGKGLLVLLRLDKNLRPRLRVQIPHKTITASLNHLRTMLPESSSCPQPTKRPIHAT